LQYDSDQSISCRSTQQLQHCAYKPPDYKSGRTRTKDAGDTLSKADSAFEKGESIATVNQLSYIAYQQVRIAQETALEKQMSCLLPMLPQNVTKFVLPQEPLKQIQRNTK